MAGLCEGGNEPPGSLKAICNRTHRHDTTVHDVIRLLIPALYKNQSDSLMAADGDFHHLCKLMAPVRHRWSISVTIGEIRNTEVVSLSAEVATDASDWTMYSRTQVRLAIKVTTVIGRLLTGRVGWYRSQLHWQQVFSHWLFTRGHAPKTLELAIITKRNVGFLCI
ncbi:hypothetical protein ANN_10151 [Periplaneta americana]|uniref:Uncharacterized protein n=1 Tax=Periplaneta americana TaxID=6978 RepID=A0ABQ8TNM3_PERAM|nr:hypothetical protein ANN_10151 [Periplaneta americana]